MRKTKWVWVVALTICGACIGAGQEPTTTPATAPDAIDLATGWQLIQQGGAEGEIEQDAVYPTTQIAHLLRIAETKAAEPGKGRVGAVSDIRVPVGDGHWYDVTFSAATPGPSIGLVFSLEGADGTVLARTTLPEIGARPRRRGGAATLPAATTAPAVWRKYLVALHARGSDSNAHVVITPIEPITNIWLDELTITPRAVEK